MKNKKKVKKNIKTNFLSSFLKLMHDMVFFYLKLACSYLINMLFQKDCFENHERIYKLTWVKMQIIFFQKWFLRYLKVKNKLLCFFKVIFIFTLFYSDYLCIKIFRVHANILLLKLANFCLIYFQISYSISMNSFFREFIL